jgi:hypothetical protein
VRLYERGDPGELIHIDIGEKVLISVANEALKTRISLLPNALDAGFLPDVLSSDIHSLGVEGPAFDVLSIMSKFLWPQRSHSIGNRGACRGNAPRRPRHPRAGQRRGCCRIAHRGGRTRFRRRHGKTAARQAAAGVP